MTAGSYNEDKAIVDTLIFFASFAE